MKEVMLVLQGSLSLTSWTNHKCKMIQFPSALEKQWFSRANDYIEASIVRSSPLFRFRKQAYMKHVLKSSFALARTLLGLA